MHSRIKLLPIEICQHQSISKTQVTLQNSSRKAIKPHNLKIKNKKTKTHLCNQHERTEESPSSAKQCTSRIHNPTNTSTANAYSSWPPHSKAPPPPPSAGPSSSISPRSSQSWSFPPHPPPHPLAQHSTSSPARRAYDSVPSKNPARCTHFRHRQLLGHSDEEHNDTAWNSGPPASPGNETPGTAAYPATHRSQTQCS